VGNSGQATISFVVTNKCKNSVGYVAVGTNGLTRIGPANGAVYNGNLGNYTVSWTNANGNPGFTSIKFNALSNNFANGAADVFSVVVNNFNSNTTIPVQGKAGITEETFTFLLSQTTCPPPSVPHAFKWLRGPLNRLLAWLAPQSAVNMPGVERGNKSWNAWAPIDFERGNNNLPAITPDGTLNWHWVSQGQRAPNNR
jgi:hypothetical protein